MGDLAGRAAVVAAARACVGTPFRPQGRVPGLGLDCVGVALAAARAAGGAARDWPLPPYRLGGDHDASMLATLQAIGCTPVDRGEPGDLLVLAPRPRLRHLGILTGSGLVHAHAGLGRVVEGPISADWQQVGHWRLPGVD
ncbi:MAG: peptidoglycan endopeptidase [Polymorphobacter sp.]|uniref:peptidoglycan endopeptidase n=1 Tax=Polymorphobacter sp. TaxID=1909290 RepID=UPI003A886CDA